MCEKLELGLFAPAPQPGSLCSSGPTETCTSLLPVPKSGGVQGESLPLVPGGWLLPLLWTQSHKEVL